MKASTLSNFAWFLIIGFWFYGAFAQISWISFIAGPILIGLFSLITYRQLVDSTNELYAKRAGQMPFLFPPSFIGKGSVKLQRVITLIVGVAFLLFGIVNLINLW